MKRNIHSYATGVVFLLILTMSPLVGMTTEKGIGVASKVDKCPEAKGKYAEGVATDDSEERRAAFQKAVDLCPSYAEAHNNLADALEKLGVQERAKKNQEHWNKGNRLIDDAERHYSRAHELKPDLIPPLKGLGDVYMLQGRYPLAAQQYRQALKLRPDSSQLRKLLDEAEKMALDNSKGIRKESQILETVRNKELSQAYETMGIANYTVADVARESFNNILFEGWSAEIMSGQPMNQLNEIGKALSSKDMANFRFVIEGHANEVGGYEENINLSQKRATAVKDFLVKKFHVDPEKIITQGFGFARTKHRPGTDHRNRRVEVVFFNESGN
jgi:outer membrane protein OmpA-like peptidoglycan-associated protein